MRYFFISCLAAMTILSILDIISTYIILSHGGMEINPVMNWLMEQMGEVNALIFPKLFCLILLVHYTFKAINLPLRKIKLNIIASVYIAVICIYVVVVMKLNIPYVLMLI
jgi:hypothetical protein